MKPLRSMFAASVIAFAVPGALAQQYPAKPVRVIVSTVPGPLDAFTRVVVQKLGERTKQNFVVENRPGAGGNVATELVAKAPSDGYTLLSAIDTTFTVNPSMYSRLPFHPERDFAIISVPVTYNQMLAVHPSVPAKSVRELLGLARQRPMSYASGGNGTPSHLAMAYFLAMSGARINHVPYKGTGQSIVDVVGGQVETIFAVVTGVYPHVQAGKLRALAVSTPQRSALAPEVASVAEQGYPKYDASFAYVFAAPASTAPEVVQMLNREMVAVLALPDVQEKNRLWDYVPTGLDPGKSSVWLRDSRAKYSKLIESAGIRVD
ncbi:MAG TPA: tripartite tricarboxylate transporter substrate-binding protein [Burkholderiales bacterium]|nr:tripartite tricarboxylate transporter substrate-binding protein [Burkholderiales bacterium]